MSHGALPRILPFESCFNFRDMGGYRARDGRTVRWRRLFRSDALHYMTTPDVVYARDELGLATVLDLRTRAEVARDGLGEFAGNGVSHFHLPLIEEVKESSEEKAEGDPKVLAERYLDFLEEGASHVARILRLLSTDVYPAVFHCAAGKDRTGIVAAVVLSLLGLDDDTIVEDYSLSNMSVERVVERMRSTPGYWEIVGDLPVETFMVLPDTIRGMLNRLRNIYGSVESFVGAHGVGSDVVVHLRAQLLE